MSVPGYGAFLSNHEQRGSYQLARWISTDKRASSDRPFAGERPTSHYRSGSIADRIDCGLTTIRPEPRPTLSITPFLDLLVAVLIECADG